MQITLETTNAAEIIINTYSGKELNLCLPDAKHIDIRDIGRGLAYNSLFSGQTPHFFSIAEHCLMMCDLMEEDGIKDPHLLMAALLHAASEAYIGNMVKPLKMYLPVYQQLEDQLQQLIYTKYFLNAADYMSRIKPYDTNAQHLGYMRFYKNAPDELRKIKYYTPHTALKLFMERFYRYMNLRRDSVQDPESETTDLD